MNENKTIILIEPDDKARENLVAQLKELTQMSIVEAKDGIEAAGKLRRQTFDLILTENEVPKKNGVDLIGVARDCKENELTPIIMYTTDIENPKIDTRGVKNLEFIKKPCDIEKLKERVTHWTNLDLKRKKFRLDVDFINPFIDSAVETLESMCKASKLEPGRTYLLGKDEKLDIDISGTLNITSPYFKGTIAISFADEVYEKLVSTLMQGKEENVNIDNQDAAAEMINIIFGKTKALLNSNGYKLERAIPKVMRGSGHNIQSSNAPVLLLPFNSNEGKFFIQICVKAT